MLKTLEGKLPKFDEDVLLDVADVAKYLGVSKQLVYDLVYQGEMPCVRIRSRIKFRLEDIKQYVLDHLIGNEEEKDD